MFPYSLATLNSTPHTVYVSAIPSNPPSNVDCPRLLEELKTQILNSKPLNKTLLKIDLAGA